MTLDDTAHRRRTLLVEDEALVAMLLSDMLTDLGFEVVEVVGRLHEAMSAAETGNFELAVLDVNLDGTLSYRVVDILRRRRIPVVFATGYGTSGLAPDYADIATIQKPFQRADLEAAISRALAAG